MFGILRDHRGWAGVYLSVCFCIFRASRTGSFLLQWVPLLLPTYPGGWSRWAAACEHKQRDRQGQARAFQDEGVMTEHTGVTADHTWILPEGWHLLILWDKGASHGPGCLLEGHTACSSHDTSCPLSAC